MELLGIQRRQLDRLRLNKGLPFVRLTPRVRVSQADEFPGWLKQYHTDG